MSRRLVLSAFFLALAATFGCDKPPVSTAPDAPIKSSENADKKGRKGASMDASLMDPGAKK